MTRVVLDLPQAHEILSVAANNLVHDAKGNIVTNSHGHTYTWDADNHLATAGGPTAFCGWVAKRQDGRAMCFAYLKNIQSNESFVGCVETHLEHLMLF